jgi:hypothetical protein
MKTSFFMLALLSATAIMAQESNQPLQDFKQKMDSLQSITQRNNLPFVIKVPKTFTNAGKTWDTNGDFNNVHPDAIVLNKTSRGTIYSLSPDKMAVLVPDLQKTEKMPGGNLYFILPPKNNMPNPLYPNKKIKLRPGYK